MSDDPLASSGPEMSPMKELELIDIAAEQAGRDEMLTMFDDDTHPKPPHCREEGVTDHAGEKTVDVMVDTPAIDPIGTFDLGEDELRDIDEF